MKKSITSNPKIKYSLLSILFSILFIFTALFISKPITAYADGSSILQSTSNGKAVNGQEIDSTSTANYLFWAASSERTGILFYIIDNTGGLYGSKKILIMDDPTIYYSASSKDGFKLRLYNAAGVEVGDSNLIRLMTPSGYSTKPVTYSDGWHATGNVNTLLNATTTLSDGEEVPYWFKYASILIGSDSTDIVMNDILASNSRWAIVAEPVSIQYIYSNSTYNVDSTNRGDTLGHVYSAGDPLPAGSDPNSDDATPYIFCGTARQLAQAQTSTTLFNYSSPNPDDGGTYTYKFLNMALPWSMCLEHDQVVAMWTGGYDYGARAPWSAPTGNGERLVSSQVASKSYATGIYFIDVSAMKPPIHTYWEPNGTPGNTEPPTTGLTDGECTIKKLYYTEKLNADGTVETEATDYHHYTQTLTTSYISIDTEEGYELEGWKTDGSNSSLTTKAQFDSISATHSGNSAQEINLDEDAGEKYLYVLLKKTEINPPEPTDYDFRLEQSQITKRVTFLESSGPANTPDLITHNFTWTAPAPSVTSCQSHGGNGHHLKCTKVWDTAPVSGVAHTHSDSCYTLTCTNASRRHTHTDSCYSLTCTIVWDTAPVAGVAHSHSDSCYDTPCSTWKWTDNTTKLGITLDTSSINKAVVSKNWSITYNATTVNTITSSNKYYKENTSTRSGTGANTQSTSQFNYITVLFRGQDHLTLADWKNGGPVSYLTNIAYDSAYNFKSANTPQGTRKSGTEYTETFAAKFINRSPDMSTTYKATVGAYGTCSAPSSNYSLGAEYTISGIKVNIQVFWAQGISPSASGTLPSTQAAGSATFYPYIKMRYDNNTQNNKSVYVLGQTRRTVTFYDYATVYITGGDKDLTITSNQWSTHSDAMNNILSKFSGRTLSTTEENRIKSSVLPGGATLSLSVNSSNTRQIVVKTIQAYLTGSGKTQVDNTGGTNSLPTDRTQLESIHTGLVSSVSGVASQAYIAQYICTGAKLNSSEMTGAQFVQPGQEFTGNGTRFSTDSKYHFNSYTDSKLNTHVNSPSYSTYTFYTDTMGNIRCSKNNTSPSETSGTIVCTKGSNTLTGGDSVMREIANKTGVILALRKGLVDNEGDDTEAPWAPDGKWYNEAFDGVTYLYAVSTIDIGIWDPLERSTVLDPKETPQQTSKGNYFTEFNSSFFRSMINGGPTANVGTFTNSNGRSRTLSLNFGELYESKVFYIPNVTTQDLK